MTNINEILFGVFSAADGKIIGKIRTQKVFYLLEQMGLNSGLRFSYHHFGPYSDQLSSQIDILSIFEPKFVETKESNGFGGEYSVLTLEEAQQHKAEKIGDLSFDQVVQSVTTMKAHTSKEIEIAATIHWLRNFEKVEDWKTELKRRKTSKADDLTIDKALSLLGSLNLN